MEYQCSHLDALSCSLINSRGVHERSMRDSSRSTVQLGVITLDEHNFRRRLSIKVIPLVCLIWADGQCLASSIRIDEVDRHQIGLGNRVSISYRERILEDCLDGAPDVNDLVASLEELVRFSWEVVRYATPGSIV